MQMRLRYSFLFAFTIDFDGGSLYYILLRT